MISQLILKFSMLFAVGTLLYNTSLEVNSSITENLPFVIYYSYWKLLLCYVLFFNIFLHK